MDVDVLRLFGGGFPLRRNAVHTAAVLPSLNPGSSGSRPLRTILLAARRLRIRVRETARSLPTIVLWPAPPNILTHAGNVGRAAAPFLVGARLRRSPSQSVGADGAAGGAAAAVDAVDLSCSWLHITTLYLVIVGRVTSQQHSSSTQVFLSSWLSPHLSTTQFTKKPFPSGLSSNLPRFGAAPIWVYKTLVRFWLLLDSLVVA